MSRHSLKGIGRVSAILGGALLLFGCNEATGPRLVATGDGRRPLRLRAAAHAMWCPGARRLEVTGLREDAGLAVVIYPQDSLVPGPYEVFDPGAYAMQRPGAAGAWRWFTEQEVRGYQSDSGSVELTRAEEQYVLRFGFRLVSVSRQDTVRLTGRVTRFTPGACPADTALSLPDSR